MPLINTTNGETFKSWSHFIYLFILKLYYQIESITMITFTATDKVMNIKKASPSLESDTIIISKNVIPDEVREALLQHCVDVISKFEVK